MIEGRSPRRFARLSRRGALILALAALMVLASAPGCSKKLSAGGGGLDVLFYDILGMDRGTAYYYDTVRNAHDSKDFGYRYGDDKYLADKCDDAILKLGDAHYNRLEGEAQVILLLSDVLLEDHSALPRALAAGSLTRLALKLPATTVVPMPDRGDRYLALVKELDALHDDQGRRRQDTPQTRQRVAVIVEEIGRLEFSDLLTTKNGLKVFPARAYITQETDPALRDIFDRAMVRRMQAVIHASLAAAIEDRKDYVREEAARGLKTLHDETAMDAVLSQLERENQPRVRGEIVEYLGAIGGPKAAEVLVPLIEDPDGGIRYQARLALTRMAGRDLGVERGPWESWRSQAFFVRAAPPASAPPGAEPARGR